MEFFIVMDRYRKLSKVSRKCKTIDVYVLEKDRNTSVLYLQSGFFFSCTDGMRVSITC